MGIDYEKIGKMHDFLMQQRVQLPVQGNLTLGEYLTENSGLISQKITSLSETGEIRIPANLVSYAYLLDKDFNEGFKAGDCRLESMFC